MLYFLVPWYCFHSVEFCTQRNFKSVLCLQKKNQIILEMWDYSSDFYIFKQKLIPTPQHLWDPLESGMVLGNMDTSTHATAHLLFFLVPLLLLFTDWKTEEEWQNLGQFSSHLLCRDNFTIVTNIKTDYLVC